MALPAAASDTALFPAAQCAALWLGYDDYAKRSAFLDRDPTDIARAAAFRAVAYRLDGGARERVDAYVAEQRRDMDRMIEATVYGGDRQSRDLFDRMMTRCAAFGQRQPETRSLP